MSFEVKFQVDFIDTDAMGIVHHASYWRWFERARVDWLKAVGMNYKKMETEGWGLPLRSCSIEYFKPLYFDDPFTVRLTINELQRASVQIGYQIENSTGVLIAEGQSMHVLCKREQGKDGSVWVPQRIPEEWKQLWLQQKEVK